MKNHSAISEADILEKVVSLLGERLHPEAARSLLRLKFDRETTNKIRQLLQKNNRGTITVEERLALEKYMRVGQFLDLLHAKARFSLEETTGSL